MASLEPIPGFPRLTAGIASQTCDAAAAVLVVSEEAVKRYGLKPRARIHHMSVLGDDPIWMLTAPIPASKRAIERAGMKLAGHRRRRMQRGVRVRADGLAGGDRLSRTNASIRMAAAISLGHPIGATGARS